ncbi:MAG: hypothetical protein IOC52_01955 [Methylobacterium sp.]|nr:hypothetical protein [Methylobacterium sp.]
MSQRYPARITRLPMLALFEARGSEAGLLAALVASGLNLPPAAKSVAGQPTRPAVLRLGPRRVLIMGEAREEAALGEALDGAFAKVPGADFALVSDMFAAFDLSGKGCADILAQGSALDLSEAAMPAGSATGTELWGTAVIIIRSEGPQPGFRIIVDRSHAGFIEDWLTVASGGTSALKPGVMIAPPRSWKPS